MYDLPPHPPLIRFGLSDYLDDEAISDKDKRLISYFYTALDKERL